MVLPSPIWVVRWRRSLALARRRDKQFAASDQQFSAIAMPLVGSLVLTGLVLAIIQLGSFRALIETQYGIILSIKLALVAMLLALAALNRFLVTPALARGSRDTRPLRRSSC